MKKNKENNNPKQLSGMAIYQEDKRTVYSPFYSKKGYIISETNCKTYKNYVRGYLVSLFIFAITYIIFKNLYVSVGFGLAFLIGTIISFYLNFIKKATLIENYKKPLRDGFINRQAKQLKFSNLILVTVCCFLLALMIMLNGKLNSFTGSYYILNTILAIISVLYGLLNTYIIIYKKTKNIQTIEDNE